MRSLVAAAAAALSAGVIVGVLAAWGGPLNASGEATPIPAPSPSVPVATATAHAPDPELPPLQRGVKLQRSRLGTPPWDIEVQVPAGWRQVQTYYNESRWLPPGFEKFTYVLRIEQVRSGQPIPTIIADRKRDLAAGQQDFTMISETADSISFSYVNDDHVRYGNLVWLPAQRGLQAGVEISLEGREVDRDGMDDLLRRVAAGVRQ